MTLKPDVWILAARPKTLWAAAAPVFIGTALAAGDGRFHALAAVLALISALFIQIGTNFYNDYRDGARGADAGTRKGPTRAVHAGLVSERSMKRATVAAFSAAVAAGVFLMVRGGLPIVVIGFCSIVFGMLYSGGRYSLADLGLADLFVFAFFGPVAVAGTYFVQALSWPAYVWVAGIAPGMLSIAILMVNNVRDVEEDRDHQKRTLVVRFGRRFGVLAYAACVLIASLTPFYLLLAENGSPFALAAAAIAPISIPLVRTMMSTPVSEGSRLNSVLASTGKLLLLYSVLFSIGWLLG